MAKNTAPQDDDIIDLTELIETGNAPSGSTPPPMDDFEDLLAGAEAADSSRVGKQPAKPVVDPHEELDMVNMGDIDNLLESLDIPPQPRESAPAPKPAQPAQQGDLDSVLDDLLGPEPAGEPPATPARDSFMDDLDAILGDDAGAPAPKSPPRPAPAPASKPAPAAPEPPAQEIESDLDDILSGLDETPPPPKKAAPVEPVADAGVGAGGKDAPDMNLDAELDDILAEAEEKPAPEAKTSPPSESENFDLPEDLDALLDEPAPPRSAVQGARPPAHVETVPAPAQTIPQELIAGICQNMMSSRDNGLQEAMNDFSRQLGAQAAHMDDMVRQTAELGKRLVACEAKLAASRARVAKLEKSMEAVATLEDLLTDGTSLHAGFTALISTAVGQALKGFPEPGQIPPEMAEKLKKLDEGERDALSRLESLEKRLERMEAGMSGQAAEAARAAVAEGLQGLAPEADAEIREKLIQLGDAEKCSTARLDSLEKRLDELEPNFNAQVEKAAAGAAARILHEEIGKLLSGM